MLFINGAMLRGSNSSLISLLQIEMHIESRDIHHFRKEDAMRLMTQNIFALISMHPNLRVIQNILITMQRNQYIPVLKFIPKK